MEITMEYHEIMVKEQARTMIGEIDNRTASFNVEFMKFANKWSSEKPSSEAVQDKETAASALNTLKEKKAEQLFLALMIYQFPKYNLMVNYMTETGIKLIKLFLGQ